MQEVLRALVIDTESDHNTNETARRVAKMFLTEVFRGRYVPMPAVTEFPNVSRLNELMIVGPVKVRSACSHHLCPILGRVWIGLLPNEHSNLIGLSKYARICDWIMSRPQIQEEAVTMLANELQDRVKPDGLAIVMEADHFCMHWRGVKDDESMMTNSVMRGAFLKDANLRREFLSLLTQEESEGRSHAGPPALRQPRRRVGRRRRAGGDPASSPKEQQPGARRDRRAVLLRQREHLPAGARGRARRGQRALQPHRRRTRATATSCCSATRRSASAASPAGRWARST